jgi:hypothetical protein
MDPISEMTGFGQIFAINLNFSAQYSISVSMSTQYGSGPDISPFHPANPQSTSNTQAAQFPSMTPPSIVDPNTMHVRRDSKDIISLDDWLDFQQAHKETEDAIRWKELTSIMEKETPEKATCSAVYSISKDPKQLLSRITGLLSASAVNTKVKIKMLLDCRCSTNLIGDTTAKILSFNWLRNADHIKLYNASGKHMSVPGQTDITLDIPELKRQGLLTFLITEDLPETEQILMGIDTLKQLQLLPYNWPHDLDFLSLKTVATKIRTKLSREQALLIKANRVKSNDIAKNMWHNMGTIQDIPRLKKLPENI